MNYLSKFIEKRRPHIIAICGENLEARYLKEDVERIVHDIQDGSRDIPVEYVDNEAAKVYMHSKQAMVNILSSKLCVLLIIFYIIDI